METKYYLYSTAIDIPVNKENPELLWNIFIDKINKIVEEKHIEKNCTPSIVYYELSPEAANIVFLNLVNQSKPSWFIREDRLYTKISLPVLLLYDCANMKKVALAAFEVLDSVVQDKAEIIWY